MEGGNESKGYEISNSLIFNDGDSPELYKTLGAPTNNKIFTKIRNEFLNNLNNNIHIVLGMMNNKDHEKYISYFKDIASITTVDIKNQMRNLLLKYFILFKFN